MTKIGIQFTQIISSDAAELNGRFGRAHSPNLDPTVDLDKVLKGEGHGVGVQLKGPPDLPDWRQPPPSPPRGPARTCPLAGDHWCQCSSLG